MTLQYLETLKALGAGPSTKFVLPLELADLARTIAGYVDRSGPGGGRDQAA